MALKMEQRCGELFPHRDDHSTLFIFDLLPQLLAGKGTCQATTITDYARKSHFCQMIDRQTREVVDLTQIGKFSHSPTSFRMSCKFHHANYKLYSQKE
jgi:hypothetical protein